MLMYQSRANLDEKSLFGKITHVENPRNGKMSMGLVWESRIQRSILVHDLVCSIEVYVASLRNGIRISIEGKSWTRLECGILVPKLAVYQHFPNFWV